MALEDWLFAVTATNEPVFKFPRVFVFTSVVPTKSSRVPVHMIMLSIELDELLMTRVTIFTKLSLNPRENVFSSVISCP